MGQDMSFFPTADHLASWAGLAPANNEFGGRQRPASTRKGNPHPRNILIECAWSVARTKTRLRARFHRLVRRFDGARNPRAVPFHVLDEGCDGLLVRDVQQPGGGAPGGKGFELGDPPRPADRADHTMFGGQGPGRRQGPGPLLTPVIRNVLLMSNSCATSGRMQRDRVTARRRGGSEFARRLASWPAVAGSGSVLDVSDRPAGSRQGRETTPLSRTVRTGLATSAITGHVPHRRYSGMGHPWSARRVQRSRWSRAGRPGCS
ncbi:IS110 family transposase [Saccharopolyspora shandongensis]